MNSLFDFMQWNLHQDILAYNGRKGSGHYLDLNDKGENQYYMKNKTRSIVM